MDHNKLWKILKEMGRADHLTGLLRNLYAGQEATVRDGHGTTECCSTGHGTTDHSNLERTMSRLPIVTLLIQLYAEYIIGNAKLDEAQAGIKISRRNINNLR